jgi:RNA polymerase sigma factor (sigma-70 family)
MQDLSTLWKGVLDKDPEAWSELVRLFEPLVYAVARKTGLSSTECDDCAQETWLALFRTRYRIENPNKIPAWLARAVSRRAGRMAKNRGTDTHTEIIPEALTPGELPDEELERLEAAALVRVAVESLGPRCRKLLHALYLSPEHKKYKDIARDLGLPPNSFGPTRTRCLNKLKSILEGMGYDQVLKPPDRDS